MKEKRTELIIDDEFYNSEVRCDYRITEKQKKIWAIQLELLYELLRVCQENDIKCVVMWGTLLGAVRHKGFIPWDDDLDVALERDEYEKLRRLGVSAFKPPFFFQTVDTDPNYFFPYARLRNSNTTGLILENVGKEYNNGIYIDIYPLDGITENRLLKSIQSKQRNIYLAAISKKMNPHKKNRNVSLKSMAVNILCAPLLLFSVKALIRKFDNCVARYNKKAAQIGLFYNPTLMDKHYYFPKAALNKIIMLPFEMLQVPVPVGYDTVLKAVYGDYMELPPVEKRGLWHEGQLVYEPEIPYKEYLESHPHLIGETD